MRSALLCLHVVLLPIHTGLTLATGANSQVYAFFVFLQRNNLFYKLLFLHPHTVFPLKASACYTVYETVCCVVKMIHITCKLWTDLQNFKSVCFELKVEAYFHVSSTTCFVFSRKTVLKMSIGVPIKVLHEAEGHIVTCETNTGEVYRGKLIEAEDNMNCQVGFYLMIKDEE